MGLRSVCARSRVHRGLRARMRDIWNDVGDVFDGYHARCGRGAERALRHSTGRDRVSSVYTLCDNNAGTRDAVHGRVRSVGHGLSRPLFFWSAVGKSPMAPCDKESTFGLQLTAAQWSFITHTLELAAGLVLAWAAVTFDVSEGTRGLKKQGKDEVDAIRADVDYIAHELDKTRRATIVGIVLIAATFYLNVTRT